MKKILSLLLFACFFWAGPVLADDFNAAAQQAFALEVSTGKILYEKDADTPVSITSFTSLLTVYLTYQEIEAGRLTWETLVPISDYPYSLTASSTITNVPMEAREYTVKDLVEAALVPSAYSASIALAEHIGGTEAQFVERMKAQLQTWGIQGGNLINASGLTPSLLGESVSPENQSTSENLLSARALATIAYHLVRDYPEVLDITKQKEISFADFTVSSYNYMLEGMPAFRGGVDGLKTATSDSSGSSFIATSLQDGMRVITVIINADNAQTNEYARFIATNSLLNYAFNNYMISPILVAGEAYDNSQALVVDGQTDTVTAVAKTDLNVVVSLNGQEKNSLSIQTDAKGYKAPLTQDSLIGTAHLVDPNLVGKGYMGDLPSVDLVPKTKVDRAFFLKVWWNHFVRYVNDYL